MNNNIIAVIVVLVLVGGGFFLFKNMGVAPTASDLNNEETPTNATTSPMGGGQATTTPPSTVKEFRVDGTPFAFSPSTITVNRGDTVRITFKNVNGTHDIKIDEFNATTRILNTGQEQTISFVADKAGTFQYYCSVGNHRAMGMVGTLTVM